MIAMWFDFPRMAAIIHGRKYPRVRIVRTIETITEMGRPLRSVTSWLTRGRYVDPV